MSVSIQKVLVKFCWMPDVVFRPLGVCVSKQYVKSLLDAKIICLIGSLSTYHGTLFANFKIKKLRRHMYISASITFSGTVPLYSSSIYISLDGIHSETDNGQKMHSSSSTASSSKPQLASAIDFETYYSQ